MTSSTERCGPNPFLGNLRNEINATPLASNEGKLIGIFSSFLFGKYSRFVSSVEKLASPSSARGGTIANCAGGPCARNAA